MANPDLTDPTNARIRDFDIPVIMPRTDFIQPGDADDGVFTGDWLHVREGSPWGP